MTTVAWDGTYMVGDTQGSAGSTIFKVIKVWKVEPKGMDPILLGGAGSYPDIIAFKMWVEAGMDLTKWPPHMRPDESTILLVKKDGTMMRFEGSPYPLPIMEKFSAIGSGGRVAMAAMEMGADAVRAVEIAKKYDLETNGELTVIHF